MKIIFVASSFFSKWAIFSVFLFVFFVVNTQSAYATWVTGWWGNTSSITTNSAITEISFLIGNTSPAQVRIAYSTTSSGCTSALSSKEYVWYDWSLFRQTITQNLSGLSPDTTYYYCAEGVSAAGGGSDYSFTYSFETLAATINGSCGSTNNACTAGTLSDTTDSSTNYLWSCSGSNGGTNASCSLAKPINGSCGSTHYNCTTGTSASNVSGSTSYTWSCNGSNGGTNATSCSEPKSAVNGSCGSTNNACTAGTLSDTTDSSTNYLWSCSGSNGGTNASCSLAKSFPDLTADAATPASATAGTAVTLSATIKNNGTMSTGSGFSNFFQVATAASGRGTITDLTATTMSILFTGGSATATQTYTFPSSGTYSIRVCADKTNSTSTGTITESNEDNNCGAWTDVAVASSAAVSSFDFSLSVSPISSSIFPGGSADADVVLTKLQGSSNSPVSISAAPILSNTTSIDTGAFHTCALLSDKTVKCWGDNFYGQLGDGTTTKKTTPTLFSTLSNATAISAGANHTCALLSDKTVKCWGSNSSGQLGDETKTQRSTPVSVSDLSNVTAISTGANHSCALLSDGTAKCWGNNDYGQLGNGTTRSRSSPVSVGLSNVTAISVGVSHTCALLSDGTAKCWGYNSYGQLGDGTTANSSILVPVSNLSNATAISAGANHSCALLSDKTVKCWGYNGYGQLGDGTTANSSILVPVSNLSNATAISAGVSHSCALLSDKTVKCWGSNSSGQLGDETKTQRSTPVSVSDLSNVTAISTGANHSCALLSDKTVKCWGDNNKGQLGNGTTRSRSNPSLVFLGKTGLSPISSPTYCTPDPICSSFLTFASSATIPAGTYPLTIVANGEGVTKTATYTLTVMTNGSCGSSNLSTFSSAPATNLCSAGTASSVLGGATGPWYWSCSGEGENGGTPASCNAFTNVVNGQCGSSDGQSFSFAPSTNLCSAGSASSVSGTGPWSWSCSGLNNGTDASCTAQKTTVICGNAVCDTGESLLTCPQDCRGTVRQF